MNQLKQSAQVAVNVSAKLLPIAIQVALIALTILWLNHGLASAHNDRTEDERLDNIEVPVDDTSDPCAEVPYANITETDGADDPCAELADDILKFAEPDESSSECEDEPQLVSFEVPEADDDPCADEGEQFANFAEPDPSEDECVEYTSGLTLIHLEFQMTSVKTAKK